MLNMIVELGLRKWVVLRLEVLRSENEEQPVRDTSARGVT